MFECSRHSHLRLVLAVLLFFATLGVGCLGGYRLIDEYVRSEHRRVADRLGIDSTKDALNGIGEYIVRLVHIRMRRNQVEKILATVGPLSIERSKRTYSASLEGPLQCDKISIRLSLWPGDVWGIYACYDLSGALTEMNSADPEAFPALGIFSP